MGGWLHEDLAKEARGDGRTAFNKGVPATANPYPAGCMECRHWNDGWAYGERLAQRETARPDVAAAE